MLMKPCASRSVWWAIIFLLSASLNLGQTVDDQKAILKQLLNDGTYDKRLRAGSGDKPVEVNVTMHIVNMGPVSEYEMSFTLTIYLRQYWVDHRLEYNGTKPLVLNYDVAKQIWMPDSFFHSETRSYIHDVTGKNMFFRLHPNGLILMSFRATVTNSCAMQLRDYPMDIQTCELRIASYGYTADDMRYMWMDTSEFNRDAITKSEGVNLANFRIINYTHESYVRNLSTGQWPTLSAKFTFGRNTLYFIIQMYVPSTLIVILSWVSFWVGQSSIPARAALGITAVLTILTLIDSTNSNMPKISYMKAIDLYYAGCFVFVFASLIEFATVCYLDQKFSKRAKKLEDQGQQHTMGSVDSRRLKDPLLDSGSYGHNLATMHRRSLWARLKNLIFGEDNNVSWHRHRPRPKRPFAVSKIDQFSRFFFPISFFTLITIYWIIYWPRTYN